MTGADGRQAGRRMERWFRLLENSAGASLSFGVSYGGRRLSPVMVHEKSPRYAYNRWVGKRWAADGGRWTEPSRATRELSGSLLKVV